MGPIGAHGLIDFWRTGVSCVDGMGKPLDRSKATFVAQCAHFFTAGGLEGQDDYRSVKNVYDSFGSICGPRVGNAELPFCRAYGDVVAAALAPQLGAATVGSAENICASMFDFSLEVKQAPFLAAGVWGEAF
ncbi:unnamed protein product [Effrenium voratum]|nr:unnamed protein product [Effrenium voratum]